MRRLFLRAFGVLLALLLACAVWLIMPVSTHPTEASAYPWRVGMSMQEVDSLAYVLLASMTLEEKISQLHGEETWPGIGKFFLRWRLGLGRRPVYAGYNARLHIPPLAAADGPRGVVVGPSTCFPIPMARGASWDVALERRVGEAIAREARAAGINYLLGGCVNVLRHPAWGRAQETYGEDPWLLGQMGAAWVQGVQAHKVMACVKHYALNSQENNRYRVNVLADERTLQEVYLPQFRKCVEAGAASVMTAYNQVNGQYCSQHDYLLSDVLRQQWGFRGFVSSDWVYGMHEAAAAAHAGLDVEMPLGSHYAHLPEAISRGQLSAALIDSMVLRVLRTKLYHLTRPEPAPRQDGDGSLPAQHRTLAREVAEQSMVLLKNDSQLLPLHPARIRRLAVIGPLATARNLGDRGSSEVPVGSMVTPLEALRAAVGNDIEITYEPGINSVKAARAASGADAVLLMAGYRPHDEGENMPPGQEPSSELTWGKGGDRPFLRLREDDEVRIRAVTEANANTIVVVYSGSAVIMDGWQAHVRSILMAWYPGVEGGAALARVLLGAANPGGKLPFSIAHSEADYPWFHPFADTLRYGLYHGYTGLDQQGKTAAFPFGFGLSYTTFRCSAPRLQATRLLPADTLRVQVQVSNTGSRSGTEVVQVYIGFPSGSPLERPQKLLRAFEKVVLDAGATRTVSLSVPVRDLAAYDPQAHAWVILPGEYTLLTGTSSRQEDLSDVAFQVAAGR